MNTADAITKIDAGLEALALVQSYAAALVRLTSLPGFGTAEGIDPAALAAVRAEEGAAQAKLAATIEAMPG